MATKLELLHGCLKRYLKATKPEKKKILDELVEHTRMHRKSVIRFLRRLQFKDPWKTGPKKRGRKVIYGTRVIAALKEIWEISSHLCAERLHPILSEYVKILKRDKDWNHSESDTALLLQMSLGTIKVKISKFQKFRRKKSNATTKPGNLKVLIPIRRGPWEDPAPGFGEIDTVVHCGSSLLGNVAYTVNFTDIASAWTVSRAQLGKGQRETLKSIQHIRKKLPFPLLGLDPDTGSEFINWHCYAWCQENDIDLSRSRPNHKNDNAHIEQKNYTSVRNFVGYGRIDTEKQVELLNKLYDGPLYYYINFFQPSVKCIEKMKVGSRYTRKYDAAQTPFQRVLADDRIDQKIKDDLTKVYQTLNPKKLKKEIDSFINKIFKVKRSR